MPKDFLQGASLTPTFEALMVKFGGKIGTLYQMLKNVFKKHPLQNRTNVQIKGGGGQRPFEQCSKKLHFFERSASLIWWMHGVKLPHSNSWMWTVLLNMRWQFCQPEEKDVVTESWEPIMNMRISLLLYSLLYPVPLRVNGNIWKTLQHLGCISCLPFSTDFGSATM